VEGVPFETDEHTLIDANIQVGDRVWVMGRILVDGRWIASEIRLLEENKPVQKFQFNGVVTSLNPWVVSGISLAVNANTQIVGEVTVGSHVSVHGVILPDGAFQAERIVRLSQELGCLSFSTAVRRVDIDRIVLVDWSTLPLGHGIIVQGELTYATMIVVSGCVNVEGTFSTINMIVVYQLQSLPVYIRPEDSHGGNGDGDGDSDGDDHDD